MKAAVEIIFKRFYYLPDRFDPFDNEERALLHGYVYVLKFIVTASKLLEGEKYPAASAVIPLVDQILTDLVQQERENKGDMKRFSYLKKNMKKWF